MSTNCLIIKLTILFSVKHKSETPDHAMPFAVDRKEDASLNTFVQLYTYESIVTTNTSMYKVLAMIVEKIQDSISTSDLARNELYTLTSIEGGGTLCPALPRY